MSYFKIDLIYINYNIIIMDPIINACKKVFQSLGVGHTEHIYHKALVYELNCLNYNIDTEMNIIVKYEDSQGKIHNLESIRIDIFIHDLNIILELKAIHRKIHAQEIAQIKKYFNVLNKENVKVDYGLIINFPQPSTKEVPIELEYIRIENP
jgi:GxxExxY protein